MKKGEIAMQTIFYIFMVAVMIAIIVFGIQRISQTTNIIDEQKINEIKGELNEIFNSCSDGLNKGKIKTYKLSHKEFDSVCVIDKEFDSEYPLLNAEFDVLKESDFDSLAVLLDTNFLDNGDSYELDKVDVIAKIPLNKVESKCYFNYEDESTLSMKVEC